MLVRGVTSSSTRFRRVCYHGQEVRGVGPDARIAEMWDIQSVPEFSLGSFGVQPGQGHHNIHSCGLLITVTTVVFIDDFIVVPEFHDRGDVLVMHSSSGMKAVV
jgi:hypothetical protein